MFTAKNEDVLVAFKSLCERYPRENVSTLWEVAGGKVSAQEDNKLGTVFLLTTGDGSDGNEWGVQSIHSTRELAEIAQAKYSELQFRHDGSSYVRESEIEEWAIDESAQRRRW